jgi:hypothetical protein
VGLLVGALGAGENRLRGRRHDLGVGKLHLGASAGGSIAVKTRQQLLPATDALLGPLDLRFGPGDRRSIFDRIFDRGDTAVGADTVAGMERILVDIAPDRRVDVVDPGGHRASRTTTERR